MQDLDLLLMHIEDLCEYIKKMGSARVFSDSHIDVLLKIAKKHSIEDEVAILIGSHFYSSFVKNYNMVESVMNGKKQLDF